MDATRNDKVQALGDALAGMFGFTLTTVVISEDEQGVGVSRSPSGDIVLTIQSDLSDGFAVLSEDNTRRLRDGLSRILGE